MRRMLTIQGEDNNIDIIRPRLIPPTRIYKNEYPKGRYNYRSKRFRRKVVKTIRFFGITGWELDDGSYVWG